MGRAVPCGSTMTLDLDFDDRGLIRAIGMEVNACAFGQASAALFAAGAVGQGADDLARHTQALEQWLANDDAPTPRWPGIEQLVPARHATARHGAMLLPFRVAVAASASHGAFAAGGHDGR